MLIDVAQVTCEENEAAVVTEEEVLVAMKSMDKNKDGSVSLEGKKASLNTLK